MRSVPSEDFDGDARSLWDRFMDRVGFGPFEEEPDQEMEPPRRRRAPVLRFHHSKVNRVGFWSTIDSVDTARPAADGLKEGRQQIVNLERASVEVAARIIDFLNGVTYALDGSVEQIGDKVFLFAPANTVVETEECGDRRPQAPYQEN